jgi:hypothetical protein
VIKCALLSRLPKAQTSITCPYTFVVKTRKLRASSLLRDKLIAARPALFVVAVAPTVVTSMDCDLEHEMVADEREITRRAGDEGPLRKARSINGLVDRLARSR